jgi:hypothetical protein
VYSKINEAGGARVLCHSVGLNLPGSALALYENEREMWQGQNKRESRRGFRSFTDTYVKKLHTGSGMSRMVKGLLFGQY